MRFQTDRHFNQFSSALSFRPTQLSGLYIWLQASNYNAGTGAWPDSSGVGNSLAPLGAGKPALTASVAALGNKPGVTFDGTAQGLFKNPLIATINQPNTVFTVANLVDVITLYVLIDGAAGRQLMRAQNQYQLNAGASLINTATPVTGGHAAMYQANGVSSAVRVDSTTTSGDAGALGQDAIYVGSANSNTGNWKGDVGEVFAYSRLLSAGEVNLAMAYLKAKYLTP